MSPSSLTDPSRGTWVCGIACIRFSAGISVPSVSAGTSSRKWCTGSQTTVRACHSAAISTSGVSLRKSSPVLDMLLLKRAWPALCLAR